MATTKSKKAMLAARGFSVEVPHLSRKGLELKEGVRLKDAAEKIGLRENLDSHSQKRFPTDPDKMRQARSSAID